MRQLLKKNVLLRSAEAGSSQPYVDQGGRKGQDKIKHKSIKRREKRKRMDLQFPLIQKRNTLRHVKMVSNKDSNKYQKTVTSYTLFL